MTGITPLQKKVGLIRVAGWAGFLAVLATVASICVALFFWAEGSAIASIVGALAAVVFAAVAITMLSVSRRKSADPQLQERMGRLRRARYRSTYQADENGA